MRNRATKCRKTLRLAHTFHVPTTFTAMPCLVDLPAELLEHIACVLDASVVAPFALASKRLASAAWPALCKLRYRVINYHAESKYVLADLLEKINLEPQLVKYVEELRLTNPFTNNKIVHGGIVRGPPLDTSPQRDLYLEWLREGDDTIIIALLLRCLPNIKTLKLLGDSRKIYRSPDELKWTAAFLETNLKEQSISIAPPQRLSKLTSVHIHKDAFGSHFSLEHQAAAFFLALPCIKRVAFRGLHKNHEVSGSSDTTPTTLPFRSSNVKEIEFSNCYMGSENLAFITGLLGAPRRLQNVIVRQPSTLHLMDCPHQRPPDVPEGLSRAPDVFTGRQGDTSRASTDLQSVALPVYPHPMLEHQEPTLYGDKPSSYCRRRWNGSRCIHRGSAMSISC